MSRTTVTLIMLSLSWAATLSADTSPDGLIFYQDFDHGGRALFGRGWAYAQRIPPERLVPGRFGKACRFERARINSLSPNQASAEMGTEGFVAGKGAKLTNAETDTAFGKRALSAEASAAGVAWSTEPVAVQVKAPYRPAKVFLFSAYLRAARPGVKVRLTLADRNEQSDWRSEVDKANKEAEKKNPKAAKPPFETVTAPALVSLDTTWRRVCAPV